jgi:hypothetical protein
MHTHTHTCTHAHTHIHTHKHNILMYTHSYTHTRTHTYTHTRTHAHIHTYMHMHARTHTHTCTHTHTHTNTTYIRTHMLIYKHKTEHTKHARLAQYCRELCYQSGTQRSSSCSPFIDAPTQSDWEQRPLKKHMQFQSSRAMLTLLPLASGEPPTG